MPFSSNRMSLHIIVIMIISCNISVTVHIIIALIIALIIDLATTIMTIIAVVLVLLIVIAWISNNWSSTLPNYCHRCPCFLGNANFCIFWLDFNSLFQSFLNDTDTHLCSEIPQYFVTDMISPKRHISEIHTNKVFSITPYVRVTKLPGN